MQCPIQRNKGCRDLKAFNCHKLGTNEFDSQVSAHTHTHTHTHTPYEEHEGHSWPLHPFIHSCGPCHGLQHNSERKKTGTQFKIFAERAWCWKVLFVVLMHPRTSWPRLSELSSAGNLVPMHAVQELVATSSIFLKNVFNTCAHKDFSTDNCKSKGQSPERKSRQRECYWALLKQENARRTALFQVKFACIREVQRNAWNVSPLLWDIISKLMGSLLCNCTVTVISSKYPTLLIRGNKECNDAIRQKSKWSHGKCEREKPVDMHLCMPGRLSTQNEKEILRFRHVHCNCN